MLLTEPTYNRTPDTALAWRARNLSQKTIWRLPLPELPFVLEVASSATT
jgi:hypothetical protein